MRPPYNPRMTPCTRLIGCLAAATLLAGCSSHNAPPPESAAAASTSAAAGTTPTDTHQAVRSVVEAFGQQMQEISVLAPPAAVRDELPRVYGEVLTPDLLAQWRAHPDLALGRQGSSPWPQRIEVHKVDCGQPDACRAVGDVDYITSNEVAHGGVFMRRAVTLEVNRNANGWRIASVRLGPPRR